MAEFASRQGPQSIRSVGVADLPAVYDLYRVIEPHDGISADGFARWWRWLYADNPPGLSVVLGSFDATGRNLGHLALLPVDFVVDGERLLACSARQLMVAEDQRRTLLYPKLVKAFFKTYPAHRCEFCYAEVTRPRVLAANLALGFRKIGRLPVYARPYRFEKLAHTRLGRFAALFKPAFWLAKTVARLGVPLAGRQYTVVEASRIPDDFEALLGSLSGQFKLAALRTVPILNWRFAGNPDRRYRMFLARDGNQPAGYIVVRRMPMREFNALAVVDLLFDCTRPDVGHALLRCAHRLAISQGVDLAATMLNEHSPYRRVLRRWGFVESPEQFTLLVHEPKDARHGLATRPASDWHITWFDHDFV